MILVPWKMFEDQFHYFFAISAQLPNLIKKKKNKMHKNAEKWVLLLSSAFFTSYEGTTNSENITST